jgi:hypothetical protein
MFAALMIGHYFSTSAFHTAINLGKSDRDR